MRAWRKIAIAAFVSAATTAGAQIRPGTAPPLSHAVSGDAASGEILSEDGNQLPLNVTPCKATQTVVVFHKPYVKSAGGNTQCNGTTKALVQVLQQ